MSIGRWVAGMVIGTAYSTGWGLLFSFHVHVPMPWNVVWISWLASACISVVCAVNVIAFLVRRSVMPRARRITLVLCCLTAMGIGLVHATIVSTLAYQLHCVEADTHMVLHR